MSAMKMSRLTKIGMGVVGGAFLVWLCVTLLTAGQSKKKTALVTDPTRCPVCGRELPNGYQGTGKCPYCEMEHMADPQSGAASESTTSPVIPIILVSAFCLLLAIHVTLFVRARISGEREEVLFHTECRKCHRRIRYRESQIGKVALCPLCKKPVFFQKPEEIFESRWTRFRRWLSIGST
jgi:predicted Zn-ribbon and HTH transcriptional regulator